MMDRIEKVILRNLVYNEEYLRKVLPFIEPQEPSARSEVVDEGSFDAAEEIVPIFVSGLLAGA